jgi:hypothetical protein
MWRPIFRKEHLKPGDRLRKELLVGEDRLWTEYEVVEAGEDELVLKPLESNGNVHEDNPVGYKKMRYDILYAGSTRIWVTMEKPGSRFLLKNEPMPVELPVNMIQAERVHFNFLGLRLKRSNPDRSSIFVLVIVLLFFLLIILQLLLEHSRGR